METAASSVSLQLSSCLSFIVVTSPSPSNPSLELIDATIGSFQYMEGTENCDVIIMMDGYKISKENRMKKGKITRQSEQMYHQYYEALVAKYALLPRYRIVRCSEHNGYGYVVKYALENHCTTKYAIIAQHDRIFKRRFHRLHELVVAMESNKHIRYIGFPTSGNINHDKMLSTLYNLRCLNRLGVKLSLGDGLYLQPIVFWFDSQHLCHVERYLQIFYPIRNMPVHLRTIIGMQLLKGMRLRRGDFIEDRFGQMQRKLLCAFGDILYDQTYTPDDDNDDDEDDATAASPSHVDDSNHGNVTNKAEHRDDDNRVSDRGAQVPLDSGDINEEDNDDDRINNDDLVSAVRKANNEDLLSVASHRSRQLLQISSPITEAIVIELFHWYGTYLCWQTNASHQFDAHLSTDGVDHSSIMVCHLKGRQLTTEHIRTKISILNSRCMDRSLVIEQSQLLLMSPDTISSATSHALSDSTTDIS